MTEFIILSKDELMTLCANIPVICYLRRKGKYVLCSEEYYAEQKESRSEIPNKSENPNTCGDAISRQAIEEIKEIMTDISGNSVYVARMSDIRTLPSVTPQQMTDVFDKIRAEIDSYCSDNRDRNDGLYIAMKIIDKYKAESEVQDDGE